MSPLQARLHNQIKKSIVEIRIFPPPPIGGGEDAYDGAIVYGTIIVLKSNFMYVVANPVRFHGKPGCMLIINCPGGLQLRYAQPVIHSTQNIVGIYCPYGDGSDISLMRAVSLSQKDVVQTQAVHVYSPMKMLLTPGSVMGVCGHKFQNNCSAVKESAFGAPVIDDKGCLKGMCINFKNDYLEAISTLAIASEIERAQSRDFISIRRMLQHLRNLKRV